MILRFDFRKATADWLPIDEKKESVCKITGDFRIWELDNKKGVAENGWAYISSVHFFFVLGFTSKGLNSIKSTKVILRFDFRKATADWLPIDEKKNVYVKLQEI